MLGMGKQCLAKKSCLAKPALEKCLEPSLKPNVHVL